jgi:Protein of unknown function (DUF2493).
MIVLVCGSRDWAEPEFLWRVLDAHHRAKPITLLIEGEAPGADTMARQWAEDRGVPFAPYPANWDKFGKAAGPIRNAEMLASGKPQLVIAFAHDLDKSRGTRDMVTKARAAGVHIKHYP